MGCLGNHRGGSPSSLIKVPVLDVRIYGVKWNALGALSLEPFITSPNKKVHNRKCHVVLGRVCSLIRRRMANSMPPTRPPAASSLYQVHLLLIACSLLKDARPRL